MSNSQTQNNRIGILSVAAIALLATALILATPISSVYASHDNGNGKSQDDKAGKSVKCNNVKVRVKVTGIEAGTDSITGTATLGGKTVSKTSDVDENETSTTLAFNFKKLSPCPSIGDEFSVEVNGQTVTGTIESLKSPNKVTVSL